MSNRTLAESEAVDKVQCGILLGVGYSVVRRLIADGTLKTTRIGTCREKVTRRSIDAALKRSGLTKQKSA